MTSALSLIPIEEREVEFYGDRISAVEVAGESGQPEIFVPVRPLCEFLGLDWSAQFRRIQRDPVLSEETRSVAVTATEAGGRRDMLCLPLEFLHGWLFGVTATRVKSEYREAVIRYQREVYRVLWRAFRPDTGVILTSRVETTERRLDQAAVVVRDIQQRLTAVEGRLSPGTPITEEQAGELQQQVKALALLLTELDPSKNHFQSIWVEINRRMGVASYRSIPADHYGQVTQFLQEWLSAASSATVN